MCGEERLAAIEERYLLLNSHAKGYVWKRGGTADSLDMNADLAANGVADETAQMLLLGIDPDDYLPVVHVYFSDDLTVA